MCFIFINRILLIYFYWLNFNDSFLLIMYFKQGLLNPFFIMSAGEL